ASEPSSPAGRGSPARRLGGLHLAAARAAGQPPKVRPAAAPGARWYPVAQRTLDVLGAVLAMVATSPVLLAAVLLVKLTSRGAFNEMLPHYGERLAVRPGLTGLAQAWLPPGGNLDGVRRKLAADLLYIDRQTLWLDLRLLAATAAKLMHLPRFVVLVICPVPP